MFAVAKLLRHSVPTSVTSLSTGSQFILSHTKILLVWPRSTDEIVRNILKTHNTIRVHCHSESMRTLLASHLIVLTSLLQRPCQSIREARYYQGSWAVNLRSPRHVYQDILCHDPSSQNIRMDPSRPTSAVGVLDMTIPTIRHIVLPIRGSAL